MKNRYVLRNYDCMSENGLYDIESKSIDCICTDIPYDVISRETNGLRNLDKKMQTK